VPRSSPSCICLLSQPLVKDRRPSDAFAIALDSCAAAQPRFPVVYFGPHIAPLQTESPISSLRRLRISKTYGVVASYAVKLCKWTGGNTRDAALCTANKHIWVDMTPFLFSFLLLSACDTLDVPDVRALRGIPVDSHIWSMRSSPTLWAYSALCAEH